MATFREAAFILLLVVFLSIIAIPHLAASASPFDTKTPVPTSTPPMPEVLAEFHRFLLIDPECLSPCWWGEVLGETDPQRIYDYLRENSSLTPVISQYTPTIKQFSLWAKVEDLAPYAITFLMTLSEENGKTSNLFINYSGFTEPSMQNGFPPALEPQHVLETYGVPTEIWFGSAGANHGLVLYYPLHQLMIDYTWRHSSGDEIITSEMAAFKFCPTIDNLFGFRLYAISRDYIEEQVSWFNDQKFFWNTHDLNIPINDLVEAFFESSSGCFEFEVSLENLEK